MGIFDNYDDSIGGTINKTPTTPKVDTKPKSGSIFANFDSQIGSTVQPTTTPQVTPNEPTTPTISEPKTFFSETTKKRDLSFFEKYKKFSDNMADVVAVPTARIMSNIGSGLISVVGSSIGSISYANRKLQELVPNPITNYLYKTIGIKDDFGEKIGESVKNYGDKASNAYFDLTGEEKNYIDNASSAIGSSLPFLFGGLAMKGVGLAEGAINASMSSLEAMVNGYEDYKAIKESGDSENMSSLKALGSFAANLGVNYITNKLGWIGKLNDPAKTVPKIIKNYLLSTLLETKQETLQELISNVSQGKPIGENLWNTFLVSIPSSALFGVAGVQNNVINIKEDKKKEKKLTELLEGIANGGNSQIEAEGVLTTLFGIPKEEAKLQIDNITSKNENLRKKLVENIKNSPTLNEKTPQPKETEIGKFVDSTPGMRQEVTEVINSVGPIEAHSIIKNELNLDSSTTRDVIRNVMDQNASEQKAQTSPLTSEEIIQNALQDNELDSTLADMKSKQALNEAGSTLEETKTPEVSNTTPGAVSPKGATDTHIRVGIEKNTTIEGNEVTKDNVKVSYKVIDALGGGQQPITTIKKTLIDNGVSEVDAESIISKTPVVEGMTYTDNVFDAITEHNNGVKSISEAQGEVKLKIKPSKESSGEEVLEYAQNLGGETIYSNAKEAIKSQNFKLETVDISEILKNDPDAKEYVDANKNRYGKQKQGVDNPIIIGNWQGKSDSVIDGYNRLLTKVQQGETTIEAYKAQGEAKMKIKDSMTDEQRDEVSKLLDGLDTTPLTVNGKPDLEDTELYFRLDQLKTKNEKGKLTNEEYIEAKGLLEEAKLGLDTLKTKIDNKEYGFHRNTTNEGGIEKGVQPNKGRVLRSGIGSEGIDSMGQKYPNFDFTKIQGSPNYANILIPRGSKESEIRDVLDWLIPDAQPEVVDAFIEFNSKLEYPIEVNRVDEVDGNPGFFAGIRPLVKGKYQFYLKSSSMSTITKEHIYHELPGHAGFESIGEEGRKIRTEAIKKQYELTPEKFKTFIKKDAKAYWEMTVDNIVSYLQNKNGGGLDNQTLIEILQEAGLMDENNKTIFPEDIMEATFNFDEINQKLNKSLKDRGYETSNKTEAHNFLMIDEINSYLIENSESFKDSTIEEINKVTNSVLDGTFKFGKIEVNLKVKSEPGPEFGGVTFKLKDSTKLTSEDIIKKHANIQLKRDIVITDVYGDKAVLKAGEGITPYEVTGNKFILQDGEAYLVSKSQAQNVINNSKTGEAKPFAPELKQTEETASPLNKSIGSSDFTTWQLPGGTDYQEIIIQAPSNKFSIDDLNFKERVLGEWKASSNGLDYGIIKEGEKFYVYRDGGILGRVVNTFNQAQQVAVDNLQGEIDKSSFISSHWPRIKNPISHIRINKRTYNGKKVAFMEELQSDWAREGRDKGFSKEITKETAKEQGFTVEKSKSTTGAEAYFIDNTTDEFFYRKGFENTGFDTEAEAWDSVIKRLKETTGAVPNNPLLKNWQELSIKRALQEAVNSNAKYFAWINGPQTAARYNLSKEVDNITWNNFGNKDSKTVMVKLKNDTLVRAVIDEKGIIKKGTESQNVPSDWVGKNISEAIGKGIGEKILAEVKGELSGEGLNVGGEWATNLYNRQVRTIVENLTGQKVEMLDMGLAIDTRATKWRITKQKGFEMFADTDIILDESNIQVGDTVTNLGSRIEDVKDTDKYVVTDILGNNKFKAVPKKVWDNLKSKDVVMVNGLADNISTKIGKENFYKRWGKLPERYFKEEFEKTQQTFDISQKTTQQMGIEITPEVKQIIKGEAPQVKVSGKLPFTEQITAPVMFKIKLPEVNTGNRAEDAKQILAHVEKKLGVASIVNSIKDKETAITIAKDVLADSPESNLEKYVADAGDFKGTLPEVTGKPIAELKKNKAFRGVKNEKTFEFAKNGDSIVKSIFSDYGIDVDSEEGRARFEKYKDTKNRIVKQEKEIKVQKDLFKKTDTFELLDSDKKLLSEIVYTKNSAPEIRELIEQVREEKAIRRKEVLEHKARPLMKYVSKKTGKLSKNFTEKSVQILDDLKFKDVDEANKAIEDYMMKMKEFVNPISRLAMDERNAKFLRDKVKIMEAVEKKMKEEGRDRKQKIEAIRDFFYMTDSEIKGVIGTRDYRLMSDKEFDEFTKKLQEESIKIAEHQMAVAEVEWTIAQKQLQKTDNFLQAMKLPTDINKLTTEQLGKLNELFNMFKTNSVFLGTRQIETLAKNTELKHIKTEDDLIEALIPNTPVEELKSMTVDWKEYIKSPVALAQSNPIFNWIINEFRRLTIIKDISVQKVEDDINRLAKAARQSRKRSFLQRLIPTDELVWDYVNERDLEMKTRIAQTMTKEELEYAHYMSHGEFGFDKKRDYLIEKEVLNHYFKDESYFTHIRRGFLEAWLKSDSKNNFFSVIPKFISAVTETVFQKNRLEQKTLNILNGRTGEILPLEKYFPYKEHRSGNLIPTKNMARVFLQYHKTFELKKMLDQIMPKAVGLAQAVAPSERTEKGLEMDTSTMEWVKDFFNTQKGRPISIAKLVVPGNSLDTAIKLGVLMVRYKFLAYNFISQVTSPIGEQYATFIQLGAKKYTLGIKRSKLTKQGNKIAEKYKAIIGEPLFDRLAKESVELGSKIGETAFMGFSIGARQANKISFLGQMTKEEFESGEVSDKRLTEIENDIYRWRPGDKLRGIMSSTSVGTVVTQFRSWAIKIAEQSIVNVNKMIEITKKDGFKSAAHSREFGELFRATVPVIIFMLLMYSIYKELRDKDDKSFSEKVVFKAMNEISSSLQSLSPATFLSLAPLQSVLTDLGLSLVDITVGLSTGEITSDGKIPGVSKLKKTVTPALFKGILEPSKEELALAKVSKSSYTAKGELEDINKELVTEAKNVWEQVKVLGQETKEAKDLLNKTYPQTKEGDTNYKIYQKAKQADMDYWKDVTEKVIPIVKQASVYGFKSDETKELTNKKNMTDDEFTVYEKIKDVLYPTSESGEQDEWDKQSFIEHVSNIAKGWTSDPIDAINKIIRGGDWKITEVTNGQIIVNRMPQSATDAMKAEVGKLNTGYKADHIWPVQGGGGSDKNNINIITTEQWKQNTPVEVYLIKQLKAGNITGEELKEYIVRFKIGRGQVTSGPLFEKYKTPMTFEEIKKEIAK